MMQFRQGDVFLISSDSVPNGAKPVQSEGGRVVLAHGEVTGHSHAIDRRACKLFRDEAGGTWLHVLRPTALRHEEHAPVKLDAGVFKVTVQREYRPEGLRNVVD